MLNVNLTISRIYQFIGEGIFLYLFIIPFYLPSEETGPFWSYLTVFTASSLFFLFAEKIRTYMPVMGISHFPRTVSVVHSSVSTPAVSGYFRFYWLAVGCSHDAWRSGE